MPLHLLGKKSWNVYNPENIARVQRDEAEARTREAEREKNQHHNDAGNRLAQLRASRDNADALLDQNSHPAERSSKKRKLDGEDDTDRDIRLAVESGQLDLVHAVTGQPRQAHRSQRSEAPPEAVGMRLADAAGRQPGSGNPWYSSTSNNGGYSHDGVSRNVWGNEDPRRQQREQRRTDANDPLAAMKKGVKQLREAESHRKAWREQRERDLNEVVEMARTQRRQRRKEELDESLDGFDLDQGYRDSHRKDVSRERRRHRHRRDRSRSPRKN